MTTFTVTSDSSPGIEISTWNNVLLESAKHARSVGRVFMGTLNIRAASAQPSIRDTLEYSGIYLHNPLEPVQYTQRGNESPLGVRSDQASKLLILYNERQITPGKKEVVVGTA